MSDWIWVVTTSISISPITDIFSYEKKYPLNWVRGIYSNSLHGCLEDGKGLIPNWFGVTFFQPTIWWLKRKYLCVV